MRGAYTLMTVFGIWNSPYDVVRQNSLLPESAQTMRPPEHGLEQRAELQSDDGRTERNGPLDIV